MLELLTGEQGVDLKTANSPLSMAIEPRWRSAILRGLDHNPAARFETVGELWAALTETGEPATLTGRWRSFTGAGLSLALLLSVPVVGDNVGATIERRGTAPAENQQSVAVLASAGPDPQPDDEAFSRGLAAAIGEQLGAATQPAAAFMFVPSGDMVDRGANSAVQAHRTLGADLIVTVAVKSASPNQITLELHRASAQQPTLMNSRRVPISNGQPTLSLVRAEVARMLAMRLSASAPPFLDARGTNPGATEHVYLRGLGYLEQGRPPKGDIARLGLAIAAFQEALELDGHYAPAYAALGETLVAKSQATRMSRRTSNCSTRPN